MIKKFIEEHDFSKVPIGPQAELTEDLQKLNNLIPWEFSGPPHGHSEYPIIKKFEINKNFTWKHGTFDKVEKVKDSLTKTFKHKKFKYGNITNIWKREENYRRTYASARFRRAVFNLDEMLQRKRRLGEIWLEDDQLLERIINNTINTIVEMFEDYTKYIGMINKDSSSNPVEILKISNKTSFLSQMDKILAEMWSFEDVKSKIILKSDSKSKSLDSSKIYVIQPFKNITMNAYSVEETKPIFKFPIGDAIGAYTFSLSSLILSALGGKRLYNGFRNTRYWFKPLSQGIKHPFLNYPYIGENTSWRREHPNCWPVEWNHSNNTCSGNIETVDGRMKIIDLIRWSEDVHTWLSTYRIGITHPLNVIQSGYFGNPQTLKANDTYMDMIGIDTDNCYDRLSHHHTNIMERNKICFKSCTKDDRSICSGFGEDVMRMNIEQAKLVFQENPSSERDKHTVPPIHNFDLPSDTQDDGNFYLSEEDESLEAAMLSWIRSNRSNR